MKRARLLLFFGGLLAAIAFFLPWGGFFSGDSHLQSVLKDATLPASRTGLSPMGAALSIAFDLLEPLAALLLITGGVLASKWERAASVWSLGGAVVSLSSMAIFFTSRVLLGGFAPSQILPFFVSGLGLVALGCLMGLLGALLGWWHQRLREAPSAGALGASAGGRGPFDQAGSLLILAGGLAAVGGLFITPYRGANATFYTAPTQSNLLDLLQQPNGYLLHWPEPVMAVVLVLCSLLALRGWKGAYLGSLCGALAAVPFLWFDLLLFGVDGFVYWLGIGYWLAVAGCVLGVSGAILGLRVRKASPVTTGMPTPHASP